MADLIRLKRDTALNWTTNNPVLALGEPGLELDTFKMKVGNGVANWVSLPYYQTSVSNENPYTLPVATTTTLGGIKLGSGLDIDSNGVVTVTVPGGTTYTLPAASASTLGGVKIGSGITVAVDGTISVDTSSLPSPTSVDWTSVNNTPTTTAGYGITDAYTKTEIDTLKDGYLQRSGGSMTGPITSLRETKVDLTSSAGVVTANLSLGNLFTLTAIENTSISVTNVPATGQVISLVLEITNGGAFSISYWTGVKWGNGTAPTLTASGKDILAFYSHDGGATFNGLVLAKDVK